MRWLIDFLKSSIGSKWLMAFTGMGWVLYLIAHMIGNLQIFMGREAINSYAAGLKAMPAVLWGARSLLLLGIVVHVAVAMKLTAANRSARPVGYAKKKNLRSTAAGRTMILTGLIVFFFMAYHIAHYTLLLTNPEYKELTDYGRHDVYNMVVLGFQNYVVSGLYIVAVALICFHLSHGFPSFFQSLGLRHPKYTPLFKTVGVLLALVLFVGFVSVPIAVMADWVGPVVGGK